MRLLGTTEDVDFAAAHELQSKAFGPPEPDAADSDASDTESISTQTDWGARTVEIYFLLHMYDFSGTCTYIYI